MAAAETVTIRRTPDEEGDLCGAKAAAKVYGVERTRIARWQRVDAEAKVRGSSERILPEPIARLPNGPIWLRADLEASARERRDAAAA